MTTNRNTPPITFTKEGVFIHYGDKDKERIGDPIRVMAVGNGLQDKLSYTVLELMDRDGKWRKAVVRSSLLTAKTAALKEQLADVFNYHLPARKFLPLVIDALAAKKPKRRIDITMVPGWQGERYVLPREIFKPEGDNWSCLFADSPTSTWASFTAGGH